MNDVHLGVLTKEALREWRDTSLNRPVVPLISVEEWHDTVYKKAGWCELPKLDYGKIMRKIAKERVGNGKDV